MSNDTAYQERLVNLVFALKQAGDTDTWRSTSWLREHVNGYTATSDEAFIKMFARDRKLLSAAGVPIETRADDNSSEKAYRIATDAYSLPGTIHFTPEEASVISVVRTMGLSDQLGELAQSGWTKIAASGVRGDNHTVGTHLAGGDFAGASAKAIALAADAITRNSRITFEYRPNPDAPATDRTMDPWALVPLRQRIYLVGYDLDRQQPRCFRMSRLRKVELDGTNTRQHHLPEGQQADVIARQTLTDFGEIIDLTLRGTASTLARCAADLTGGAIPTTLAQAARDTQVTVTFPHVLRRTALDAITPRAQHLEIISPTDLVAEVCSSLHTAAHSAQELLDHARAQGAWPPADPAPHDENSTRPAGTTDDSDGMELLYTATPDAGRSSSRRRSVASPKRVNEIVRLLNLLPYFQANSGRSIFESAADFGTDPQDLLKDLHLLNFCGLPGLEYHCMVDMEANYKAVTIDNAQGLDVPLRLTTTEASILLLALESMESMPELTDSRVVASAADKLRQFLPTSAPAVADIHGEDMPSPLDDATTITLQQAISNRHSLELLYQADPTTQPSQRSVSPSYLFATGGHTYLTALDAGSGQFRNFRLDRIKHATDTGAAADPAAGSITFDAADPFGFHRTGVKTQLAIRSDYHWLSDRIPMTIGDPLDVATPTEAGEEATHTWRAAELYSADDEWLVDLLLTYGHALRLRHRPDIAHRVAERSTAPMCAYHDGHVTPNLSDK